MNTTPPTKQLPETVTVYPPAKVNLYLEILGCRPDGYHEIETLMVKVNLRDRLEVKRADTYSLACQPDIGVPAEQNLVTRACQALEAATGRGLPVAAKLWKNIPHGAGLGGGSADAAYMLRALDTLYSLRLDRRHLADVAGRIGSDVPAFLFPGAVICRGRGELVVDHFLVRGFELLLAYPGFSLPTAIVYETVKMGLTGNVKNVDWHVWKKALRTGRLPEAGAFNRLAEAAEEADGRIREVRSGMAGIAGTEALLCGSGSAFALLLERQKPVRHLQEIADSMKELRRAGWQCYRCRVANG